MNTLPIFARYETILAVIPGSTDRDRVLIVKEVKAGQADHIELRQQSYGDGVGWFTQNSLTLAADQVEQLRSALALAANAPQAFTPRPTIFRP